ncbi:hypothetical protein D9M68_862900 [compost metagenome]
MFHPLLVDRLEGVLGGEPGGLALELAVNPGVAPLGDERARLIAQLSCFTQRQLRVGPQRDAGTSAQPGVAEVPLLGAIG